MASERSTVDNRTTAFGPPFPCVYFSFWFFAWVPDGAEIEEDRGLDKGKGWGRSTYHRPVKELLFRPEWAMGE
jgi:hypothetical protein